MSIKASEFCFLSTAITFQEWLSFNAPELYAGLIAHLREGRGCNANQQKMSEILHEISKDRDKIVSLTEFLRSNFPQCLTNPVQSRARGDLNKHKVFDFYDPSLRTYPKRLILLQADEGDLRRAVLLFCAKQGYCEHVIIDDRAYVEYLPVDAAALRGRINESSWQIRRYKRRQGLI